MLQQSALLLKAAAHDPLRRPVRRLSPAGAVVGSSALATPFSGSLLIYASSYASTSDVSLVHLKNKKLSYRRDSARRWL